MFLVFTIFYPKRNKIIIKLPNAQYFFLIKLIHWQSFNFAYLHFHSQLCCQNRPPLYPQIPKIPSNRHVSQPQDAWFSLKEQSESQKTAQRTHSSSQTKP